jgi:hypothetical protein
VTWVVKIRAHSYVEPHYDPFPQRLEKKKKKTIYFKCCLLFKDVYQLGFFFFLPFESIVQNCEGWTEIYWLEQMVVFFGVRELRDCFKPQCSFQQWIAFQSA